MPFPPSEPTATFPYRIESRVGEGAMGIVYRAFEPQLERRVAIKVLRPEIFAAPEATDRQDSRLRFLQEARAAASFTHAGATTIYRIGEEEGAPYIAMEWLDGATLEEALKRQGPFSPELAGRLGVELLETLNAAHRAGVIHRDIKPANLILLHSGRLKVTDFGIARRPGHDLVKTQAGMVYATPRFASPEQLTGAELDGRSDLFSAGVVLFHLLTGRFPFTGESFLEVASAVLRDEPLPLRRAAPHLPEPLAQVIDRALAKDPEQRFANAAKMAAALESALRSTGPVATPPSETPTRAVPAAAPAAAPAGLHDLPADPPLTAAAVGESWPARAGRQPVQGLLDRLLDRPLHAAAFAGLARLGDACLFLADGLLLGAVDKATGATGDAVLEALPAEAAAVLHLVPEAHGARFVRTLASLLHPPKVRQDGLDSSFVHLPALAERLSQEGFDGFLRLERLGAFGWVPFAGGRAQPPFFTGGWTGVPIERPWTEWVAAVPVRARVEEAIQAPAFLSYRRELANTEVEVLRTLEAGRSVGATGRFALGKLTTGRFAKKGSGPVGLPGVRLQPKSTGGALAVENDPMLRFLAASLTTFPAFFAERDRTARWKYLVEWLADVKTARLHADLPRPATPVVDRFDLATFDADGRVLHLAHRVAQVTQAAVQAFRDKVIEAKTARIKTGDVGGVFLVGRDFTDEALELYRMPPPVERSGKWTLGLEESFTGYEGFVRVGPRRGFHFLLVEETDEGFFPILP